MTLSGEEREVKGEKWKQTIQNGVIVDFESWVKFTQWAKKECRKHNNECVDRKQ